MDFYVEVKYQDTNDRLDKTAFIVYGTSKEWAVQQKGIYRNVEIHAKFKLYYCDEDHYGDDCTTYCIAHDDNTNGHYTCDPNIGKLICNPGYANPSAQLPHT